MSILGLAAQSLWNRRGTAALTILTIAISVALLLGVQLLKNAAKEGFFNTISGADLIVGARSGPVNLLLYSVFRIGDATSNVSWATYEKIAKHPDVAWTIPMSLGDTHRGFRVLGTDDNYFQHYRFGDNQPLQLASGHALDGDFDVVLGADVARALGYQLGHTVVIAHGLGNVSFVLHDNKPFRVAGILKRTGTPVDRTVHIALAAIAELHNEGSHLQRSSEEHTDTAAAPPPASITAFIVGMRSRVMTLTMERAINEYRSEPLLAIVPGVALNRLWELVSITDTALTVVAGFVVLAGLLGMLTAILTSLNERRREMAILRSVGAQPRHILALMLSECGLLAAGGVAVGVLLTYFSLLFARPMLQDQLGLFIAIKPPSAIAVAILVAIIMCAFLVGLVPGVRAYRATLSDGLQIRL